MRVDALGVYTCTGQQAEVPMDEASNNRLVALAADIRDAHAGAEASALAHATRALDAGRALIEAKSLVRHGRWLPWLKEYCHLSERTAQLYMRLAELDVPPAIIAHLGMNKAAQTGLPAGWVIPARFRAEAPNTLRAPDHLAGYSEAVQREWLLFAQFIRSPGHVEWCMRQGWESPDAWLADAAYRHRNRMRVSRPRVSCRVGWRSGYGTRRSRARRSRRNWRCPTLPEIRNRGCGFGRAMSRLCQVKSSRSSSPLCAILRHAPTPEARTTKAIGAAAVDLLLLSSARRVLA
jgi:hypothetical protein